MQLQSVMERSFPNERSSEECDDSLSIRAAHHDNSSLSSARVPVRIEPATGKKVETTSLTPETLTQFAAQLSGLFFRSRNKS